MKIKEKEGDSVNRILVALNSRGKFRATKTKRRVAKKGRGNILPPLVAMHKFGRNIGLYELTFIDRELRGHNFRHFIAYGKSWGISRRAVS